MRHNKKTKNKKFWTKPKVINFSITKTSSATWVGSAEDLTYSANS